MIWRLLIRSIGTALLFTTCVFADTLVLDNGDELTGTFKGEEDGKIVFVSPVLGEVRVSTLDAVVELDVESDPTSLREEAEVVGPLPEEKAGTGEEVAASEPDPEPEEKTSAEPGERTGQLLGERWHKPLFNRWYGFWEDNVIFEFLGKYYPLMDWKNKFELGLDFDFAQSDSRSALVRLSTEKDAEEHNIRIETSYEFAETTNPQGVKTQTRDRIRAALRLQRDFNGDRFFGQSRTSYNRDAVSEIYHELQETLGIGYRVVRTDRWELSLVPNVGAHYQEVGDADYRFGYVASLQQDLDYQFTKRIRLTEEAHLSYVPKAADDYAHVFKFRGSVENRLNSQMYLNLRYEYQYDRRIENPAARASKSVTMSIGAEF